MLKDLESSATFKGIEWFNARAKMVNGCLTSLNLRILYVYGGVLKQPPRVLHQRQYLRDARRAETFSMG